MLPFFASFIIFALILHLRMSKSTKIEQDEMESFWEKEHKANSTRKKPLDALDYIQIPLDTLPLNLLPENDTAISCQSSIQKLANASIVNLTGISNTDLKLEYGVANLNALMEYDQNYTLLARNLQKLADQYYDSGLFAECKCILEFAVSTRTDISKTYKQLAEIYILENTMEKISSLYEICESLKGPSRPIIYRILTEFCPYNDLPHSS